MKDFVEAVLSKLAGQIDDNAMMAVAAALAVGETAHKKALLVVLQRVRDASYNDGFDAGYKGGYSEGFDEGTEAGFEDGQRSQSSQLFLD